MSVMTIPHIMERIRTASSQSPIAVFVPDQHVLEPALDAVFANTTITQRLIEEGSPRFLGTFDKTMDLGKVFDILNNAALAVAGITSSREEDYGL